MPGPIPAPNPPVTWIYPPAPAKATSSFTLAADYLKPGDEVDLEKVTSRVVD